MQIAIRRSELLLLVCWIVSCSRPPSAVQERQITARVGAAQSPVLSRDGTTIAFASVADGYNNPQIWVGRADGAAPARPLTSGTSQNNAPEFSPDGREIFFTSSREPHGIYRVSTSGGAPELVIKDAFAPRISPDGKSLLYSIGTKLMERDLSGGPEAVPLPDVANSYAPLWSPDGARILVTTSTPEQREPEWWLVPAKGGQPRKTSFGATLRSQGFNYIAINAWLPGDWIVFTGRQGETQTLWKVQLNPDGTTAGTAVRATENAAGDFDASLTAGKLVFARARVDMNIWALSLDGTGEHIASPPEPLTSSPVQKGQESAAGSKLLYSAENGDRFSLYLASRSQTGEVPKKLNDGFYALLAPDGTNYVYGEGTKEQLTLYMKSLSWWSFWSTKLCELCGMPRQFSPDGMKLLLWSDSPPIRHFDLLDLKTLKMNRIVSASEDLKAPRLSPDGRWISFVAATGNRQWQAFLAPLSFEKETSRSDWVPVTPISETFFFAFWSSRGDLIYTLSSHNQGGNLRFLDAHRLDSLTKRPVGVPLPVYEFNEALVPGMDPIWNTAGVDGNRIVLELGGVGTDIWIR